MTKLSSEKIFQGLLTRMSRKRLQEKILKVSSFLQNLLTFFFFFIIRPLVDNSKAQKEEKDKAAKADDPKAGADVGKIVNLMAGDCNRVRNIICFFSFFFL